jgi:hypothetical protein
MKKSRFSESQIVAILKEGEAGVSVAQRYNEIRPHDALGSLPPARYREQLLAVETPV